MASNQAGRIGGATRLGEFWEEERQSVTSQTQRNQDEKRYLPSHAVKHRQELLMNLSYKSYLVINPIGQLIITISLCAFIWD